MGAGAAKTLSGIFAGGCEEGSPWKKQGRGPKLRQLFGAYRHVDLWDAYRRFKQVCSDGDGHITFQEAKQVVPVAEFSLLFVWDIFSQQNELLDARTLLAAVGVFSSAKLAEKAHFLLSLFDASGCGRCTGAEIAQMCHAVCGVLARCTGSVVKAKELTAQLQQELPALLPEFRAAAERDGSQVAFQNERLVGRTELDRLVPSIEAEYEALPVAGPPPDKADPPPPRHLRNPGVPGNHGAYPQQAAERGLLRDSSSGLLAAGGGLSGVRALAGQATMTSQQAVVPLRPERSGAVSKQGPKKEEPEGATSSWQLAGGSGTLSRTSSSKAILAPEKAWMVIHGESNDGGSSPDTTSFRHLFLRGVSSALQLPASCVEVLDISKEDSLSVEFLLHPYYRNAEKDERDAKALMFQLGRQLSQPSSALRRGRFGAYAASAELLFGGASLTTSLAPAGLVGNGKQLLHDQGSQTSPAFLLEVLRRTLALEKERLARAEAAETDARAALLEREVALNEIRACREALDGVETGTEEMDIVTGKPTGKSEAEASMLSTGVSTISQGSEGSQHELVLGECLVGTNLATSVEQFGDELSRPQTTFTADLAAGALLKEVDAVAQTAPRGGS